MKAVSWLAAVVLLSLDLFEECFGAPAVVLCPKRIGLERLRQGLVKWTEFVEVRTDDTPAEWLRAL